MDIDDRVELKLGDTWTDITGDVYARTPIRITRGRAAEAARVDPGRCRLTLNNRGGKYSPRNPRSPYYGVIGRNTPIRVTVPAGETFLRVPASGVGNNTTGAASGATTPDHPSLDITGDLDVRVDARLDNWGRGRLVELVGKQEIAGDQRSWRLLQLGDSGVLEFFWSTDGTNAGGRAVQSTVPLPADPGERIAVRAALDVDNGAGGWTLRFYTAPTLTEPWVQLGAPVTGTGTTSVYASSAQLSVGDVTGLTLDPPVGRFHGMELRNSAGTVVANPDFTAQPVGTTAFADGAGRTWSLGGAAEITDRLHRFTGEVSSWPPRWDVSGRDVYTPIEASGVLRRLGQGAKALESTLRRRLPSLGPAAYWPMEDGPLATQAASPIDGVPPMWFEGLDPAANSTLASSAPLPVIRSKDGLAGFYGEVPQPAGPVTEWQVQCVYRIDQVNPDLAEMFRIVTSGTANEWVFEQSDNQFDIVAYANHTQIYRQPVGTGLDLYKQWISLTFHVAQVGGTVTWDIAWQDVGGDAGGFFGSFAGVIGFPVALSGPFFGYPAVLDGMSIGHMSVWAPVVPTAYDGAITAWAGETADERMRRLSTEEGLPFVLAGIVSDTERVGAQGQAALLDLLGECAEADGGVLYESRDALGLIYRPRTTLYTQPPALVLDYASGRGEVAPGLEPVDDDQAVRNDVTVRRDGGSSSRVVLTDGPLSTQPPPAGVGPYPEEVTRNFHTDAQTQPHADWRLRLGTWDEARYPAVTVRLHAAPHLTDAVCAVDSGDRITIANPPPWLPPGDIDLLAQGYEEVIGPDTWEITFNCSPGGPWLVGVLEDPVYGRVDTDASQLTTAVDAVQTTLAVTVTDGPVWVTAAPALNSNPSFEDGLAGWTANGSTIAHVQLPSPAPGAWVMSITPDGGAVFPRAESDVVFVAAGAQYIVSGWVRCAENTYVELNVNWFDSGGVYMDTSATPHDAVAGAWAWVQNTVTAPAGAARATIAPTAPGTPPSSRVLFVKQVTLRPATAGASPSDFPFDIDVGGERMTVTAVAGASSPQTFTVTRSVDGVVKAHQPGADVRLADPSYVAL